VFSPEVTLGPHCARAAGASDNPSRVPGIKRGWM
jgi:hypothetical protein